MSYNVSECFCAFVWWRQTSWFSSLVRFIDFTQKDSHFNITWLMSLTPLQTELPYALEVLPLAHSWYLTYWTLSSLWYRKGKWGKRKKKNSHKAPSNSPACNGIPSGSRHNNNLFQANMWQTQTFFHSLWVVPVAKWLVKHIRATVSPPTCWYIILSTFTQLCQLTQSLEKIINIQYSPVGFILHEGKKQELSYFYSENAL